LLHPLCRSGHRWRPRCNWYAKEICSLPGGKVFTFFKQVPNILTSTRGALAVLFPLVPSKARGTVVLLAMATEYLDGALARRFHAESKLGQVLDPIADKLFFGCVTGTLMAEKQLRVRELLALSVRDVVVSMGVMGAALRGHWSRAAESTPLWSGKVATALQYGVMLQLVTGRALSRSWVSATFAAGTVAASQYVGRFLREAGAEAEVGDQGRAAA